MKQFSILSLAVLAFSGVATASVTIDFDISPVYQAGGAQQVAAGSIGVLVADTGGGGFASGSALIGATLSNGSLLGGDQILRVFQASDLDIGAGVSMGFNDSIGLTYGGGLAAGTALAFYWFPTVSELGATLVGGESYGFYRSDIVESGSDMAFALPADTGGAYTLSVSGIGNSLQANSVAGVPEPGRVVLALLGLLGLSLRRRR